jgi:hypothetical protein
MNRLFDDVFRGFAQIPFGMDQFDGATASWPRIEISETENEMKVTAELPGLDEKDIQVERGRTENPRLVGFTARLGHGLFRRFGPRDRSGGANRASFAAPYARSADPHLGETM